MMTNESTEDKASDAVSGRDEPFVMCGDGGNMYFGKDCPKGMVQIEFVGCSPESKTGDYGWKPEKSAFIEVYVDGKRFRIQVGNFHDGHGDRRGLHIVHGLDVEVEKTSINASSLFFKDT